MLGFYNYTVLLTYAGLACGIAGVFLAFTGRVDVAVLLLLIAGCLDMFDGKVASTRERTPQEKRFGIQIDSLSDLVAFGVLPAAIGYGVGLTAVWYIPIACLYVLAALIRLAYFNVLEEERQDTEGGRRKSYTGLPVTPVSGFLALLYLFEQPLDSLHPALFSYVYLAALTVFGLLFLAKYVKIKKLSGRGMIVVTALGVLLFAAILAKAIL